MWCTNKISSKQPTSFYISGWDPFSVFHTSFHQTTSAELSPHIQLCPELRPLSWLDTNLSRQEPEEEDLVQASSDKGL